MKALALVLAAGLLVGQAARPVTLLSEVREADAAGLALLAVLPPARFEGAEQGLAALLRLTAVGSGGGL